MAFSSTQRIGDGRIFIFGPVPIQFPKLNKTKTYSIAASTANADNLDDAGTQAAIGHDGTGTAILVHGTDGPIGTFPSKSSERSALWLPSSCDGGGEGFVRLGFGAIADVSAAAKGYEEGRCGCGRMAETGG